MPDPSKAVFLSYASQDGEAAGRIAEALRDAGVEVWFDKSELVGGDAWDQKIRRQIKECALFVPIISANTQARREAYFRLEWKLAVDRSHLMAEGTPFLLPLVIDATNEYQALVPAEFSRVQWTRFAGGEPDGRFIERVRTMLGGEPVSVSSSPKPAQASAPVVAAAVPPATPELSIAVLPFLNMSRDEENEYFSDGISEELINLLVRSPELKVSARTSAFHFKGTSTPLAEIARQLGVAYVVEGSVRKAGNRVRITAQLIKVSDGFHLWSDTFTRDLTDIFAVQDEIAGLIARKLSLKLVPFTGAARKVNPEAYRLFLEGRAIFNREVPDDYRLAIQCFRQSLDIDPTAALTWTNLALVYSLAAGSGGASIEEGSRLAREAAERALELDPHQAKGYSARAFVHLVSDWDWGEARRLLERALELAPGDAEAISLQAHLAGITGRSEDAIALARKALELDPLNIFSNYAVVRSLTGAGRFAETEKEAERMIALNPSGLRGRIFHSFAMLFQDRPGDAARVAETVPAGWGRRFTLACARFAQGRQAESEEQLQELIAHDSASAPYQIAQVYGFRGEIDEAFRWLEESYRLRDPGTPLLKCDPLLRNLHADPRWQAFLRKMNLADEQLG